MVNSHHPVIQASSQTRLQAGHREAGVDIYTPSSMTCPGQASWQRYLHICKQVLYSVKPCVFVDQHSRIPDRMGK